MKIGIVSAVNGVIGQIERELPARAARASLKLKNASLEVLRGQRSGLSYRAPTGGMYTASAPGEPPAWRSGTLGKNWRPVTTGSNGQNPAIESNVPYSWLDEGSPGGMIKPRPYSEKIITTAQPEIDAIYSEPYDITL